MTLDITVGGMSVEVLDASLDMTLGERALFRCTLEKPLFEPLNGMPVVVTYDGVRVFKGSVQRREWGGIRDKFSQLEYVLECGDMSRVAERWTVAGNFETREGKVTWTFGGVVRWIVVNLLAADGITVGVVEDGPVLERITFNYETAAEAIRILAEMIGFLWWVDEQGALHFRARASNAAPFRLTETSRNYSDLRASEPDTSMRNRQYLRGGMGAGDIREESFVGREPVGGMPDNERTLRYPIANTEDDLPEVTMRRTVYSEAGQPYYEWYPMSVAAHPDEGVDFWFNPGEAVLHGGLVQDQKIYVRYKPQVPVVVMMDDAEAIASRSAVEGGTGVYEAFEMDEAIEASSLAQEKVSALIRRYGRSTNLRTATFETRSHGLRPGQRLTLDIPPMRLSGEWLVQSVTARGLRPHRMSYEVSLVAGDAVDVWTDYFRKLGRKRFQRGDAEQLLIMRHTQTRLGLTTSAAVFLGAYGTGDAFVGSALVGSAHAG